MNKSASEANELLQKVAQANVAGVNVAVFPPFPYLAAASKILEGSSIKYGAQNAYFELQGAFTGEVSMSILYSLGCSYCIIGHSERRNYFGETDSIIAKKISAACQSSITPILCVGEDIGSRRAGREKGVVARQLIAALDSFGANEELIVAYEPVWAIGSGTTATPAQANEMCSFISGQLHELGIKGDRVLYGGSVVPQNAGDLLEKKGINGLLLGSASLGDGFLQIIEIAKDEYKNRI
ncbi:MAG: triose-phosphate isomerase [Eubacteriaceae bacterium]|nr:triose-phosphate isomerase [Eubacteriaceae bacterium]